LDLIEKVGDVEQIVVGAENGVPASSARSPT
jgi:hypothetical protein